MHHSRRTADGQRRHGILRHGRSRRSRRKTIDRIVAEAGSSGADADGEVSRRSDASHLRRRETAVGRNTLTRTLCNAHRLAFTIRAARRYAASSFNSPLNMAAHKLAPASPLATLVVEPPQRKRLSAPRCRSSYSRPACRTRGAAQARRESADGWSRIRTSASFTGSTAVGGCSNCPSARPVSRSSAASRNDRLR
jgi:hypothetical protein